MKKGPVTGAEKSNMIMCATKPTLQEPVKDPARLEWREVTRVAHYYLPACAVLGAADRSVNAMTRPMQVQEDLPPYGGDKS